MKLPVKKDISFIVIAFTMSLFSVWYACSQGTGPRTRTARELATVINLSELTPTESLRFQNVANTEVSPCGDDVTLAEAIHNPSHCPLAHLAARFVVEQIKEDYNEEEISKAYLARYAKVKGAAIPLSGSPKKGAETPKATFVVFTDFRCPYCAKAAHKLDEVLRQYPDDVALIFKHLPLSSIHPQAEVASRAAFAAGRQEKFWEMHDMLFSIAGTDLDEERLNQIAEGLGLDVDKFREDFESTAATAAMENDRTLAQKMGITGTPAIFINGRRIATGYKGIDIRLREELLRATK